MRRIRDSIENKFLAWIFSIPVSKYSKARFLFYVGWLMPIYGVRWLLASLFMGKSAFPKHPADPRTRTLTFSVQAEGFGGQFARYVTALKVAQILGLTYVHHPFERNFHCPDIDWDEFVGFAELHQESFSTCNSVRIVNLPYFDLTTNRHLQLFLLKLITQKIHWQDHVHFVLHPWSWIPPEADPEFATVLYSSLRSQYLSKRLTDPLPVFSEQGKMYVAVIIRRGEIADWRESGDTQSGRIANWRWVKIDWYLELLQSLYTKLGEENIECHVFSDVSDRKQLESLLIFPGIRLHTKDEPLQPLMLFNAIVESDVTVCGLTMICYAAGVLGNGTMIVPPNEAQAVYFPNGERWIEIHDSTSGGHDRLDTTLRGLKTKKGI
jgi:hypothetical protein